MKILIIAEHDEHKLNPNIKQLVNAATKINNEIDVLVIGNNIENIAKECSKIKNVSKIISADSESFKNLISENLLPTILKICKNYTHILAPSTSFGKDLLPRIAASLDVAQFSDVIEILAPNKVKRPVYAGNAIAVIESSDPIILMTIRTSAFDKTEEGGEAPIEKTEIAATQGSCKFISIEKSDSSRPELTSARIVVSGGRGLGSSENFKLLEKLADKLGAAIGASRAAVDAGFVPNDYQVGQTGKIVAPDLYIAVGISGAIQHLAGMKSSKVIVAINKDENAPIFEVADYGLVADLFETVPQLIEKL